ncbi:alpha/beta hydrolase fold domain-containing protein [Bradyrhizobium sp. 1]|uniref:alpha/beta hydrolase n=1 Tax=Bradyrhizobium sp. 1 TaxID=241591 RepID=UPI001FFB1AB7|nr:alpha/beta hydrolase fold domain-containing protein [Bradyrhizobium sp. 1]
MVRQNATEWGLQPNKIGFLGACAAGHMGASLGAKFAKKVYAPVDAADSLSARPDFLLLLYPVVSMEDKVTHLESRTNLLGKDPSSELIKEYSADQQVTKDSPMTFVVVAKDDPAVPPENSIQYHEALKKLGVSSELHTFAGAAMALASTMRASCRSPAGHNPLRAG